MESGAEEELEIPLAVVGARAPVVARFAPEHEPEPGDTLRLGIPPERIHLFDLQSRGAIEVTP